MLTITQQIKAVLFDCDNTLVLSENLAFAACAELANELLEQYGKTKRFTGPELLSTFVGQNFRGTLNGLQEKYDFKMPPKQVDDYVDRELGKTIEKLEADAEPCHNVMPVLEKMRQEGKYKMSIVSSSAMSRVVASIEKTDINQYFPKGTVFSAASSLNPPSSKPNPAIYLHACKELGFAPGECVAIEDSRSGATAAKNAKIPLMGYVGPYYEEGEEKVKEMVKVLSEECGAITIMHDWKEFDACMKKVLDA